MIHFDEEGVIVADSGLLTFYDYKEDEIIFYDKYTRVSCYLILAINPATMLLERMLMTEPSRGLFDDIRDLPQRFKDVIYLGEL